MLHVAAEQLQPGDLEPSVMGARGEAEAWRTPLVIGEYGIGPTAPNADLWMGTQAELHDRYLATYGIEMRAPVQFVTMRVHAVVPVEKPEPARDRPAASRPVPTGTRSVFFAETGAHAPVPEHRWEDLRPGAELDGPAIVEGAATSVVVPPAWRATLDTMRNVVLEPRP